MVLRTVLVLVLRIRRIKVASINLGPITGSGSPYQAGRGERKGGDTYKCLALLNCFFQQPYTVFYTLPWKVCIELWYKYYSGGWCTWPTPLKYAESKFKYTEA